MVVRMDNQFIPSQEAAAENTGRELLSLSVLVTREEYIESAALLRRSKAAQGITVSMILGAFLVAAGVACILFGDRIGMAAPAALCIFVPGIFLLGYDPFFAPVFHRASAAREFDENAELRLATAYRFDKDGVVISNARFEGRLPLSLASEWTETPTLFLIRYGTEHQLTLPKRIMDESEKNTLRQLAKNR